jgi:hypothetical protein
MAAALVSGQSAINGSDASSTTIAVAFPGNVTAGNLILVAVKNSASPDPTISDTLGNTYSRIAGASINHSVDLYGMDCYYAKDILGGANTVTATYGNTFRKNIAIYEISGLDTVAPADQANVSEGADTSMESGSITMTGDGVIFSLFGTAGGQSVTADSDYTNFQENTTGRAGTALRFTAAITDEAIHTASVANNWVHGIANFKVVAAGGVAGNIAWITA